MKHLKDISKKVPARAFICDVEDHPGAKDSIIGFLSKPVSTIQDHIDHLTGSDSND